jgi:hypothetical protein
MGKSTSKKPKKAPPPIVRFAMVVQDYGALSRLGRAGAMKKKEIAAKDRARKIRFMISCAEEIAREANEYLCPVH